MRRVIATLLAFCLLPAPAFAGLAEAEANALKDEIRHLTEAVEALTRTVQRQESRIQELEAEKREPEAKAERPAPVSLPVVRAEAPKGLSVFNPEIGAVADIVAKLTESGEDGEGNDKISVRHLELVLGHDVDPFTRMDVVLGLSDYEHHIHVGEAYITRWELPWDTKIRLGRVRPKVGKSAPLHLGMLDTVDQPLVVQSYLGHEGLARTGIEGNWFLPEFADTLTQELSLNLSEGGVGEGGALFGETSRRPSFFGHLKNAWDINDENTFELGATYLTGAKGEEENFDVHSLGLDATWIAYPTPSTRLKWQSEVYLQHREDTDPGLSNDPWGMYSLLDYRLGPKWGTGLRFDYVELVDAPISNPRSADMGAAAYLTFYQSEFARWRAQVQHVECAEGGNDNRFYLQGTFAIGVHKHQLQ
ncbi:MAG: hypothetical protein JW937_06595 [Candidatus Omnitrophica bacterium]|nr:hypothetical protein [Candidatus Omnitrophota bacterium]